jgi:glycosyltransferase involved in cell wall biosynthesis
MMPMYEVTIGIPVYRACQYIEDSLLSALNQTFLSIEFLIVDDKGGDGSMDIVVNLQKNHPQGKDIRILVNDMNSGVSYSRNRIIDEAKGRYLYFMDSDDTIEPDTIQLLFDAIVENKAQIAYGSYEIIDGIGGLPTVKYQKDSLILKGKDELALYAFKNNQIFHVSVCNHLVDLDFLRQSKVRFIDVSYWEDMAYTTELVTKVESAVLLSDVTYHYLRRPDSLSHYQGRVALEKKELLNNISVLIYLKEKCLTFRGKIYLPYLSYNLQMVSFYLVCHIMRHSQLIIPKFTNKEIKVIMKYPVPVSYILSYKDKRFPNCMFAFLSFLPLCFHLPLIWLLGKYKGVL